MNEFARKFDHLVRGTFVMAALAATVSCDGGQSTPTGPSSPANPVALFSLEGTWQGALTVIYDPYLDGEPPCVETASATIEQVGVNLVGSLSKGEQCYLETSIRFEGHLDGDTVLGRVYLTEDVWPVVGQASADGFWIEAYGARWDFHR